METFCILMSIILYAHQSQPKQSDQILSVPQAASLLPLLHNVLQQLLPPSPPQFPSSALKLLCCGATCSPHTVPSSWEPSRALINSPSMWSTTHWSTHPVLPSNSCTCFSLSATLRVLWGQYHDSLIFTSSLDTYHSLAHSRNLINVYCVNEYETKVIYTILFGRKMWCYKIRDLGKALGK